MRWVLFGTVALWACSGGSFDGEGERSPEAGGEAGETTTGGKGGSVSTGGKSGAASGGTDSEGGESTGGAETGGKGGTGGSEPTGGTSQGGSAGCGPVTFFLDEDGDGYGVDSDTAEACEAPDGYAEDAGDCDDQNEDINPGREDVCDGLDNDCAGEWDTGCADGCEVASSPLGGETTRVMCRVELSWPEAVAACEGMGLWLSSDNDQWITSDDLTNHSQWLGATDSEVEGEWRWIRDGSLVLDSAETHWFVNEPGAEDCMYWSAGQGWRDANCETGAMYFACVE